MTNFATKFNNKADKSEFSKQTPNYNPHEQGLGRDQSIDSKHSKDIMKKIFTFLVGACLSVGAMAQGALVFEANAGVKSKMTAYDGTEVSYTAYERLFYVTNVEDSTYQFLNVYVPDGANQQTPIFLRTYVGGYMASPAAQPQAGDATGRALKEGYVVVIPGTRGRNSSIVADKVYAKKHRGVKKGQTIDYHRRNKCRRCYVGTDGSHGQQSRVCRTAEGNGCCR